MDKEIILDGNTIRAFLMTMVKMKRDTLLALSSPGNFIPKMNISNFNLNTKFELVYTDLYESYIIKDLKNSDIVTWKKDIKITDVIKWLGNFSDNDIMDAVEGYTRYVYSNLYIKINSTSLHSKVLDALKLISYPANRDKKLSFNVVDKHNQQHEIYYDSETEKFMENRYMLNNGNNSETKPVEFELDELFEFLKEVPYFQVSDTLNDLSYELSK